jgi:hypothetical protein
VKTTVLAQMDYGKPRKWTRHLGLQRVTPAWPRGRRSVSAEIDDCETIRRQYQDFGESNCAA